MNKYIYIANKLITISYEKNKEIVYGRRKYVTISYKYFSLN